MHDEIQLLQFLISKNFRQNKQDCYDADSILGNIRVSKFPFYLNGLHAVTCWRKDKRFHKEVIEYSTDYGESVRSPHMDIEPVAGSVLFRWHKHLFPADFPIKAPTLLTLRVILDGKSVFESHLLIEKKS